MKTLKETLKADGQTLKVEVFGSENIRKGDNV